jgi:two-component system cell cycle sensor histidine kinase/response regulator CckA
VHVSDVARVFGSLAPGRNLIGLTMAALGILLGTAVILALNLRGHVLRVRLDELAIREREVARKNEELRKEIEERKAAQEASARLGMAVEQVGDTIVITDTEGVIQYVNPAFEKTSGYSRGEALGRKPGILKSGKHGPEHYRELWDTLRRGEVWSGEFVNRRKDGVLYEEIAVISPLRDDSGTTVNYVAVKRELTNENRLKEQLRQAQKMEAIGTLAGGIAHDFNNLLTAVMGYSELIMQRLGTEDPMWKEVEEIRKAGERATSLTRQLLAFSRRQILSPRIVDLNAIVTGMEKMLRRLIREDIELTATLDERLWKAKVDPGQMEQVLMNLVVNARDAMPGGGALSIRTGNASFPEGR